jgi:hypothetical protein
MLVISSSVFMCVCIMGVVGWELGFHDAFGVFLDCLFDHVFVGIV